VFKKGTALGPPKVMLHLGGFEVGSHPVEGDGYDLIYIKDGNPSLQVFNGPFYALMDLFAGPHLPSLQIFQDVDLTGPQRGIIQPSIPVSVVIEIILSEAGLKAFIPGF
jgi:hypothetical protein